MNQEWRWACGWPCLIDWDRGFIEGKVWGCALSRERTWKWGAGGDPWCCIFPAEALQIPLNKTRRDSCWELLPKTRTVAARDSLCKEGRPQKNGYISAPSFPTESWHKKSCWPMCSGRCLLFQPVWGAVVPCTSSGCNKIHVDVRWYSVTYVLKMVPVSCLSSLKSQKPFFFFLVSPSVPGG